jgi:hypothetical protein
METKVQKSNKVMITKLLSHMYVARWSDTTLLSKISWAHCTRDCSYKALRHRQNGIGVFCLNLSPWMTYASKFSNSLPETSFRPSNPMISFCNCGITLTLSPFTMRCVPSRKRSWSRYWPSNFSPIRCKICQLALPLVHTRLNLLKPCHI